MHLSLIHRISAYFCRATCLLSLLIFGMKAMGMTKKEQQTISFYNDNAKQWAENHGSGSKPSFWLPELHLFQELLPQGNILGIGFGGAGEAAEFECFFCDGKMIVI